MKGKFNFTNNLPMRTLNWTNEKHHSVFPDDANRGTNSSTGIISKEASARLVIALCLVSNSHKHIQYANFSWIWTSVTSRLTSRLTNRLTMPEKGAMKVIVIQTYRMRMRLMAKMAMLKQSMIDTILNMNMNNYQDLKKIVAKDWDLAAVIWLGLSRLSYT